MVICWYDVSNWSCFKNANKLAQLQRTEKDRKEQERQTHERKVLETCRKGGIQDRILCPSYGVLGGRWTIWIVIEHPLFMQKYCMMIFCFNKFLINSFGRCGYWKYDV